MLKNLKVQIFLTLMIILFILSAVNAISTYAIKLENYQREYESRQEETAELAGNMLKYISLGKIYYLQKPQSVSLLKEGSGFPIIFSTDVVNFVPEFEKYAEYPKSTLRLNWSFIIGLLGSFCALIFSYDAISSEKRKGALRLQSLTGVSLKMILFSKFMSIFLLFLISLLLGVGITILIYIIYAGTFSGILLGKMLLFTLISLPFLTFFIFVGILISMSKNIQSNIVIALTIWVLFLVIIPYASGILGVYFSPLKTNQEYQEELREAWTKELNQWREKYDDEENRIYKVSGTKYLHEGYRARAIYAAEERKSEVKLRQFSEMERQYQLIERIRFLSPYTLLEKIYEILLDKGYYRFQREFQQFRNRHAEIVDTLKEEDQKNERSFHMFYSWAYGEHFALRGTGEFIFSPEPYPDGDELVYSEYITEHWRGKLIKVLPLLLILALFNVVSLIACLEKAKIYDIR